MSDAGVGSATWQGPRLRLVMGLGRPQERRLLHFGRQDPGLRVASRHSSAPDARKTFARFVALGDKTGLLALKQHFKHVSIAMTDRYVGRDLELLDLVDVERQHGIRQALDELLGADCLAGKLGEQIVARNQRFRGRAGQQVRGDYVRMVLEETDLVVLPHEYGYCVYRAEVARCGGVWARVGLSTCIGCSNFAVAPVHMPFWDRRREDGNALLADLDTLAGRETAAKAVRDMIGEAESVLARITVAPG